jgi:hypothetical protein
MSHGGLHPRHENVACPAGIEKNRTVPIPVGPLTAIY